jgi:hypothetical protein
MDFKKLILILFIFCLAGCEKPSDEKTCWDCYYLDNRTMKQTLPHEIYCDLTADQMDTVYFDLGKCNTVERKCFNMKYPYEKP